MEQARRRRDGIRRRGHRRDRARPRYFTGFAPSSPSIGLLRDGKLLYMVERRDIESRPAQAIADLLTMAFDKFCAPQTAKTR